MAKKKAAKGKVAKEKAKSPVRKASAPKPSAKAKKKPASPKPSNAKKTSPGKAAVIRSASVASPKKAKLLLCRLSHTASDWVQMTWEDASSKKSWTYFVDREPLRRIAREIRGEPEDYPGRPPGKLEVLEAIGPSVKPDSKEYRDALHSLARSGAQLHKAALGSEGRRHPKSDSKPFRDWFNANVLSAPHGTWRIVMIHLGLDTEVVVPWGLAFAQRKDRDGEDERIDDMAPTADGMSGFWCMGYAASAVGIGYTASSEEEFPLPPQQTKVGIVVEIGAHGLDAHTREDMTFSSEDRNFVLDSRKKLDQHAKSYKGQHNFFYVSLNAKGGVYRLEDSDLEGRDLTLAMAPIRKGRIVFVMLDGDCVIRGDRGAEWIEDMLMDRERGVFAVETDITNPQHRFFGWTFMRDAIVAGRPLIEGVTSARIKHWPRSLLYGLYCTPLQALLQPPKDFLSKTKFVDDIIAGHVAALKQKAKS